MYKVNGIPFRVRSCIIERLYDSRRDIYNKLQQYQVPDPDEWLSYDDIIQLFDPSYQYGRIFTNSLYNEDQNDICVVNHGVIRDIYAYYIYTIRGHHPTAYVVVGNDHPAYQLDLENECQDIVHGGVTYCDYLLNDVVALSDNKWVFGWDYAHAGDFTTASIPIFGRSDMDWGSKRGKKWSGDEIFGDILCMVDFLESIF